MQTLAFVAPEAVIPRVLEKLKAYLKPVALEALTEEDFSIWTTPEGTLFKDGSSFLLVISTQYVLSSPISSRLEARRTPGQRQRRRSRQMGRGAPQVHRFQERRSSYHF